MTTYGIAFDALIKPWQINIFGPTVAFTTIYTALMYSSLLLDLRIFSAGVSDYVRVQFWRIELTLSVVVALLIYILLYSAYYLFIVEPRVKDSDFGPPEERLIPGLAAAFFVPAGLFLFAWTARPSVH